MGGCDIAVTPSALDSAAIAVRSVGERVRVSVEKLIAPVGSYLGDLTCGQSLIDAQLAVGKTLVSSASGVLSLSRALNEAGDAYGLADAVAVRGQSHS